jgi:hypothetical protein
MPKRDPLTYPKLQRSLDTLGKALTESQKRPLIGVTQGGSSRKYSGCKPAATNGLWRPPTKKEYRLG